MNTFWELASLILQIVQMGFYLAALDKYKDKLEELAEWLKTYADINREHYEHFRALDVDFYNYYRTLPGYAECESNIQRSKGSAFYDYGSRLRRSLSSQRGYTPLSAVHFNNMQSARGVNISASQRASTAIAERKRVDEHVLERWTAITHAPVGVEQYSPVYMSRIIQQSFNSFKAAAHGFNSAGTAFGNTLYQILN